MKQQERTQKTKERILAAAIAEFGTKSYESASVNAICSESQIPKGLLYHNFKNKDALYLQCVKICFDQMTAFLSAQHFDMQDVQSSLQKMLSLRQDFFATHPHYANIFFNSVLQPPKHLLPQLHDIRRELDAFNAQCYRNMLQHLSLRDGITLETALEYFSIFQELFNEIFQRKVEQGSDYHAFISEHEGKLSTILDIMLYGIAKQSPSDQHKL